jgi:hypothetical protein
MLSSLQLKCADGIEIHRFMSDQFSASELNECGSQD